MSINQNLMDYYVKKYRDGDIHYLGESAKLAAEKYIEAEKAYELRNYRQYDPSLPWPEPDEVYLNKAIERLHDGKPFCPYTRYGGIFHGVRRSELPHNASIGEYVKVRYYFMQEWCQIGGFVVRVMDWPTGRGLVIRLRDSWNSFNPSPGAWRYLSLWMPKNGSMAGFL